ncbi:MAG: glycosyltransferase [Bacillota bacterium]
MSHLLYLIRPAEGGMRGHLQSLLNYFSAGMKLHLAAPEDTQLDIPSTAGTRINLPLGTGLNPAHDLRSFWRFYRILREIRPALLHIHGFKAALIGAPAARLAGTPLVITVHNYPADLTGQRFIPHLSILPGLRKARYIAVSHALARELTGWGVNPSLITVIHNGIEPAPFEKAAALRCAGRVGSGAVVGTVARLVSQKGLDYFLQAAVRLAVRYPKMRFLVAGDGPERDKLRNLARRLGLGEKMHFAGYSSQIATHLAAMDIFVLPSLTEGLATSLLEAQAAGCAVVAARVGGVPEVVEDGRTGLLVPPADGAALAAAVVSLVENPLLAVRLARAGQENVKMQFSLQAMLGRTAAVYEEIIR